MNPYQIALDDLQAEIERLREFIRETMQLDRMPSEWMDAARYHTRTEAKCCYGRCTGTPGCFREEEMK